jgi:hypothetical protein
MAAYSFDSDILERRRRELGMTCPQLAERSGVSLPTVRRILRGGLDRATTANTVAVAVALGLRPQFEPIDDSHDFRQKEATKKARKLVGMVQGSSGLEAQAVDPDTVERMVAQTVHELMAGSRRKLWIPM